MWVQNLAGDSMSLDLNFGVGLKCSVDQNVYAKKLFFLSSLIKGEGSSSICYITTLSFNLHHFVNLATRTNKIKVETSSKCYFFKKKEVPT